MTKKIAIISALLVFALLSFSMNASGDVKIERIKGLTEEKIRQAWEKSSQLIDDIDISETYPYIEEFKKAAKKYKVPLPLLLAVARGESNFDTHAKSDKNCYGVMQILWPGTAKHLGIEKLSDLYEPRKNIEAGAKYLAELVDRFKGDLYRAVAAYNYGPTAIEKAKDTLPEGARWYADYIHRHLNAVTSEPYVKAERTLLLRCTRYATASRYVGYLQDEIAELPLEIFKSETGTYDAYLVTKTKQDKQRFLAVLEKELLVTPLKSATP